MERSFQINNPNLKLEDIQNIINLPDNGIRNFVNSSDNSMFNKNFMPNMPLIVQNIQEKVEETDKFFEKNMSIFFYKSLIVFLLFLKKKFFFFLKLFLLNFY